MKKARILDIISRAFDGAPPPDEDHRSLLQAEAWDQYRIIDKSRDHNGRWQDLPEEHIYACPNAIFHLDEQGIRYYLPALMSFCILTPQKRRLRHEGPLVYVLRPSSGDLKNYQRRRFSLLTHPQREAILRFLEHVEAPQENLEPWRRVVAADDDPSWFQKFY